MTIEQESINSQYIEALAIVEKKLFTTHGNAIACDLHEILCDDDEDHNCIACNLASAIEGIKLDISRIIYTSNPEYPEFDFRLYVMSLYLCIERVNVVLDIMQLPKSYKENKSHFGVFTEVKRWANFFKHPRSFMFAHHPVFLDGSQDSSAYSIVIDTEVVNKYWKESRDSIKYTEEHLVNNDQVAVVIPNIIDLTSRFCDAINLFLVIPKENKIVSDILRDRATLRAYFEKLETESVSEESPYDEQ